MWGELRRNGYEGGILSFEPITTAHEQLKVTARRYPNWEIAPRGALGRVPGYAEINVSEATTASSLLEVEQTALAVAQHVRRIGTERVQVWRLDDLITADWKSPFALKLDVQGFEAEVLAGAKNVLSRTEIVMTEMSLTPMYKSGASFVEIYSQIEQCGFRCVALNHSFVDNARNEVLEVDALFVRKQPAPG